jgi:hypothetical protein
MVSIVSPLFLLWFSARQLTKGLRQCRVAAPYKFIAGTICFACALLSAIDFFKGPSARKLGAFLVCDGFVLISAILLAFVMSAQTNALHKSDDCDRPDDLVSAKRTP